MRTFPRLATVLVLAGATVMLSSCGDRKSVYPMRGRVLDAQGKPLAGASLIFHPLDAAPDDVRHKPATTTDKEGQFTLTTYTENDGAPAGEYAVTIEWRPIPRSPMEPEKPDRLNGKYRDPKTTPFRATVKSGTNELEPFRLP
jgi:hypothetical protein